MRYNTNTFVLYRRVDIVRIMPSKKEIKTNGLVIRNLRKQRGITQQQVAGKLGISRASYISLEKGVRALCIPEAKKLAEVFGVSATIFLGEPEQNFEKYKQMLFAFLRNDIAKDKKVPKTKLAKLLYLADFGWYYEHLDSMSGMQYRKIQYGPVPDAYFRIVDDLYEQKKLAIEQTGEGAMLISQTKKGSGESIDLLSAKEKAFIAKIAKKWKNKNTREIVDFTHTQMPYTFCEDGAYIAYELITQEDPKYVY